MIMRLIQSLTGKTRNLLLWRDDQGRLQMETVWKPEGIRLRAREMPRRGFAMACRPLCGWDLKRPHLTCFTGCRIRRVYYHKLPDVNELDRVILFEFRVLKRRRFARLKDLLMKETISLIDNLLCN
jgi:hypothetical protein